MTLSQEKLIEAMPNKYGKDSNGKFYQKYHSEETGTEFFIISTYGE